MIGGPLRAMLWDTSQPEAITLLVWAAYVIAVLALFLRPVRRVPAPASPAPEVSTVS